MRTGCLTVETACPICKGVVRFPDQDACEHCHWPVLLYTGRPDAEHLRELDKLSLFHRKGLEQQKRLEEEFVKITAREQEGRPLHKQQQEQLQAMQEKLVLLSRQMEILQSNSLLSVDLTTLRKKADELQRILVAQRKKMDMAGNISPAPLTLRCTYDPSFNEIVAVATRLWRSEPVKIELLLGVAVSSQPFTHFSEADMIIPVKDQRASIKVNDVDEELRLPLARRPEGPVNHHQVIHLYHHTVPKFIIE